ncbi:MAG: nucleotidyltransferase family protein [Chloroflexi bacterium]|nr:nucleotidyltransferase family protein [Chloroflexota bacterium]MCI0834155.1 nucleotidyltransferase family protein [Chloroflexota bacterium]
MNDPFFALSIAGGRGERLRPLTDNRPKPMVEINGKPIIGYQVDWMRAQGVTDVVFLCGYMGEMIQDYFGDGTEHGITAHYSFEESPLGRGGAIKQGLSLVPKDARYVLVANGDVITNQPLAPIAELHEKTGAMGTMMLVQYPNQYGVVESDDQNVVTRFIEKGSLPFWINAGVYLFDRQIESLLPDIGDHETTTFQDLAKQGRLAAYRSEMAWTSIESAKDLSDITNQIREGRLTLAES